MSFGYDTRVFGRGTVEPCEHNFTRDHNPDLLEAYYSIQRKVSQADIGRFPVYDEQGLETFSRT